MQKEKRPSSQGATWGLAILLSIVGVSIHQSVGAFLIGAALGVLLAQVLHLRSRTAALDEQLQELKQRLAAFKAAPDVSATQPSATPQPAPQPAAAAPASAPPAPAPRPVNTETLLSQPLPAARPLVPSPPTAADRAVAWFIAWLKRGNPLARAGIVILFFGAAFLAKYAAEHSMFPVELRFIGLALGAFALLIVGWRLRVRRRVYAELLQGGGIAGLYLTVFAATRLYHLLPFSLAFVLLAVVALAAAVLAVAQNALPLAVIGTAGGFLAPILVSTGSGNYVALFTYYALLNLGVFAVAWFRTWRVLNVLGFLFTFTITGLWRATSYQDSDLFAADAFLILFFLMYVAVSVLNCVRQAPNLKGYLSGSLVFGLPVVAFTLHATMVSRIEYALAWSALTLGAFYLLLGWILFATRRETFRLLVEAFAALGVIFASLAIPLAFDTRTTAAMWAVEGAGLLWLGVRQGRRLPRLFGLLLQASAGVGYLIGYASLRSTQPILNSAFLGATMLAASGVFSGYWLFRNEERRAQYKAGFAAGFTFWGVMWWFIGGGNEIGRYFAQSALGSALIYTSITAAILTWLGIRRQWPLPRWIALFLPAVACVYGFAHAQVLGHPFEQWGALGWLAIFVTHFALLRIAEPERHPALEWLHGGAVWGLALLVAWELSWQVAERTTGVWASLAWGFVPALLLAWFGRKELRPDWPVAQHAIAYRLYASVPLAVALGVWILVINLSSSGDPSWLPYLPLLNPLDVCVALAMASLAMWWSALGPEQRTAVWDHDIRVLIAIAAAIVFVWLNAALIRSLHHNWGAPLTAYGIAHSTFVQSALSIFWGVLGFAAMTAAARQRWRYVWMVGVGLMGVVIAKLFFVDLSSINTVARIASFLTVGLLLVVTGYLAPLPPKREALR
ncbi:MAG TPA: DUF2339 domain-containing protein [Steroidobacteraceae bacterium]|nr:DUF2339 domain-containing protein [Steroidobacteraceae bacterium]